MFYNNRLPITHRRWSGCIGWLGWIGVDEVVGVVGVVRVNGVDGFDIKFHSFSIFSVFTCVRNNPAVGVRGPAAPRGRGGVGTTPTLLLPLVGVWASLSSLKCLTARLNPSKRRLLRFNFRGLRRHATTWTGIEILTGLLLTSPTISRDHSFALWFRPKSGKVQR